VTQTPKKRDAFVKPNGTEPSRGGVILKNFFKKKRGRWGEKGRLNKTKRHEKPARVPPTADQCGHIAPSQSVRLVKSEDGEKEESKNGISELDPIFVW